MITLKTISAHVPVSLEAVPDWQRPDKTKTNKINAFIFALAQALKTLESPYCVVVQKFSHDGEIWGYYEIHHKDNAEMGLHFTSAYNTPTKVTVTGTWPEYRFSRPDRKGKDWESAKAFIPYDVNSLSIGLSIEREPLSAAKDILRRFTPAYEKQFGLMCEQRESFKTAIANEQRAAEAIKAAYPKQGYVTHTGMMTARAWHAHGYLEAKAQEHSADIHINLRVSPEHFPAIVAAMGKLID